MNPQAYNPQWVCYNNDGSVNNVRTAMRYVLATTLETLFRYRELNWRIETLRILGALSPKELVWLLETNLRLEYGDPESNVVFRDLLEEAYGEDMLKVALSFSEVIKSKTIDSLMQTVMALEGSKV